VGKLTERNDRTQISVITEPKELNNFLVTPGIEVTNLAFANDDVVWISWKYSAETHVPYLRHTNVIIDGYVTEGVRIHLYRYLERLGESSIVTLIPSSTFRRETNRDLSKRGTMT